MKSMIWWFRWNKPEGKVLGIFRMHDALPTGQTVKDLRQLRLVRDFRDPLWKQRWAFRNELRARGASWRVVARLIRTGDSGNIPIFEELQ